MERELERLIPDDRDTPATGGSDGLDAVRPTRDERGEREPPHLKSKLFRNDAKLQNCLVSDRGHINTKVNNSGTHVTKIQQALETLLSADLHSEKGKFGRTTSITVKQYKNTRELLKASQKLGQADDTIGKGTIKRLDEEMADFEKNGRGRGGLVIPVDEKKRSGSALARLDVSLAIRKIDVAIAKLTTFKATLTVRRVTESSLPAFDPVTVQALNTHFRLSKFDLPSIAPRRPVTLADVDHLLLHYGKIRNLLVLNETTFTDGAPLDKNGNLVAAASVLNSNKVIFSSHFRNFTDAEAQMIGPNSRAAVLIHEGFHGVDAAKKSGDDENVHISEFSDKYDKQSADNSLFNPSSYAGFAAHVFPPGTDPNPRFGLGKGRFL